MKNIEDRFKRPDSNLQLVFVCAMWLTGFDVPSMSTLYLDKPMKAHTLMQAIARANRTFPGKQFGMIVDYVNVFKFMRKALRDYAVGDDGDEFPVKNMDELLKYLDAAIAEGYDFTDPTRSFPEGYQRGNARTNDWFGMLNLSLTWKFVLPEKTACKMTE